MNRFQRIKKILGGIIMIVFAAILFLIPEEGFQLVAFIISFLLLIYGIRLLSFYFTMARHMVGGKSSLYQAVIILDIGLFAGSIASMNSFIILFYLLGVFAFSGFVDVLRAFEAKRFGGAWRTKLFIGVVNVLFALLILILGLILDDKRILVYGFGASLVYSGLTRIITASRKTAIIYIQ